MVRVGRIVSEICKAEHGVNGAMLVELLFADSDYIIHAYAKKLNAFDFLVEILTALIGLKMGIPIAEPVIAITEHGEVLFSSIDVRYPDVLHDLDIHEDRVLMTEKTEHALKKLSEWRFIHDAIAFDEWIANDDRNLGNILHDGRGEYVLIDHNRALRTPFAPDMPVNNQLLIVKMLFSVDEVAKQRLKAQLELHIKNIDISIIDDIQKSLVTASNEKILTNMVEFLTARLCHLLHITHLKITTKQQSL